MPNRGCIPYQSWPTRIHTIMKNKWSNGKEHLEPMSTQVKEIRRLCWNGSVNVQVVLDQSLSLEGLSVEERTLLFKLNRNSYIMCYFDGIIAKFSNLIKNKEFAKQTEKWGFLLTDHQDSPLPWNYPLGVLFDTYGEHVKKYEANMIQTFNLKLVHNDIVTFKNFLPLYDGLKQVRLYWMHQWKQACYIMHGSAKRVMSLTVQEVDLFWEACFNGISENYEKTSTKIVNYSKRIPLRICSPTQIMQPVCTSETVLRKLLLQELNAECETVIIQGVEISTLHLVRDLYTRFASFDGFLYIILI
mgnify:FL=1